MLREERFIVTLSVLETSRMSDFQSSNHSKNKALLQTFCNLIPFVNPPLFNHMKRTTFKKNHYGRVLSKEPTEVALMCMYDVHSA